MIPQGAQATEITGLLRAWRRGDAAAEHVDEEAIVERRHDGPHVEGAADRGENVPLLFQLVADFRRRIPQRQ